MEPEQQQGLNEDDMRLNVLMFQEGQQPQAELSDEDTVAYDENSEVNEDYV
jgi:hypothetical protein